MATGFNSLAVDESWFAQHPDPIEFVLRGICRYDATADRWTRVAVPNANVTIRIPPRAPGDSNAERTVVEIPHETALFWVQWVERREDERSSRNQSLHDTLAASGPVLCNDVDLSPPPAGHIPACVPFANSAEARFVPLPAEACAVIGKFPEAR